MEPPANPYQSPQTSPDLPRRHHSWRRGILAGLLAGTLAAAATWGGGCLMTMANDLPGRQNWVALDFSDVTRKFAAPCYAMFVLFAMAAIANYAPVTRQGMVRALRRVGMYGMLAAVLSVVVSPLFPPQRRGPPDLRKVLVGTSVFVSVMIFGGFRITRKQINQDRAAIERANAEPAGT